MIRLRSMAPRDRVFVAVVAGIPTGLWSFATYQSADIAPRLVIVVIAAIVAKRAADLISDRLRGRTEPEDDSHRSGGRHALSVVLLLAWMSLFYVPASDVHALPWSFMVGPWLAAGFYLSYEAGDLVADYFAVRAVPSPPVARPDGSSHGPSA